MRAILNEMVLGVEIQQGYMYLHLRPSNSNGFVAHLIESYMLPSAIRKQHLEVPLQSNNFLAANDELREILGKLGTVKPSSFYYSFPDSLNVDRDIVIEDRDPTSHREIWIDCITPFRKDNPEAIQFFEAIAKSSYSEGSPSWKESSTNPELLMICVQLKKKYAHDTTRLATYQALAELF